MHDKASYRLPRKTLPSLDLSHHIEDIEEFRKFMDGFGVETKNTRIERYALYLKALCENGEVQGAEFFKNSVGCPFDSDIDWYLYVIREVHELMWILKGVKVYEPKGIRDKLSFIVGGSDFAALDKNSESRNYQYELRVASYFCQAGYDVDLTSMTDLIVESRKDVFYIECKRVASENKLRKRLIGARDQLLSRMPKQKNGKVAYGIIASDVTKVAFPHNGLTWALTPDHSREVIQRKIRDIRRKVSNFKLLSSRDNIMTCWLQIHMPSLVMHPTMTTTRFSSTSLDDITMGKKGKRSLRRYYRAVSIGDKPDPRNVKGKRVKLRRGVCIPAGSLMHLEDSILSEFIENGEVQSRGDDCEVGSLIINCEKHVFYFCEFQMAIANLTDRELALCKQGGGYAVGCLLAKMLFHRFPYKDMKIEGEPVSEEYAKNLPWNKEA